MLVISGRAYKRNVIFCLTGFVLLVTLFLSWDESSKMAVSASRPPFDTLFAFASFLKHLVVWVYAALTLCVGLSLRRPQLVADETGLHARALLCNGRIQHLRWDEISHVTVSPAAPLLLQWKRSLRRRRPSRTLFLYVADPAYFKRQGWRGKSLRFCTGGAALAVSEQIVGPQFDELLALVNARSQKPA